MRPALYTPEQYEAFWTGVAAIAAVSTFFVAAAAALFAWWQFVHMREARKEDAIRLRETQEADARLARELQQSEARRARQLQEEQAQPYVVVDFEMQANILIALVVRNTGLTAAYNVKLEFDPELASTFDKDRDPPLRETMFIKKGIPTMPPGRVWTALFERGPDRYNDKDLPRSYDAVVTFSDRHGREFELRYRLDLDIFFGIRNLGRYDIHHAAEALREIRTTLAQWTEGRRGISVFTRDGHAKDARVTAEREQMLRTLESNRREDGSIVSEWTEQQMNSDWNEQHVAVDRPPESETDEDKGS